MAGQASHRAIAAPGPLLRRADHPSTHRIEHDVSAHIHEIRIVLHDLRIEPRLKDVPDVLVPSVPPLCVIAIELMHRA